MSKENKFGAKSRWHDGIKFRSELEIICYTLLQEAGLDFEYEPLTITLVEEAEYPLPSFERRGKKFKEAPIKSPKITYTPDFVGQDWVIETKGYLTPSSRLRWKLFKRWLIKNNRAWHLFMPTNKKEIQESIKIIKELN